MIINPFFHVRLPAIDRTSKNDCLDQEQVKKLLNLPSTSNHNGIRDRAILSLIVDGCLQLWQVVEVNVEDVDFLAECVYVPSRSEKKSIIYLSSQTVIALRRWVNVRSMFAVDTDALFVAMHWTAGRKPPGGRLSTRGVRNVVDGYLRSLGVKENGVSSNALRRIMK